MYMFLRASTVLFNVSATSVYNHPNGNGDRHNNEFEDIDTRLRYLPAYNTSSMIGKSNVGVGDDFSCTERDVFRVFAGVVGHRIDARHPWHGPLRSSAASAVGLNVKGATDFTGSVPAEDAILPDEFPGEERGQTEDEEVLLRAGDISVHRILASILHAV
jgi:hypothetical protein